MILVVEVPVGGDRKVVAAIVTDKEAVAGFGLLGAAMNVVVVVVAGAVAASVVFGDVAAFSISSPTLLLLPNSVCCCPNFRVR